jgi:ribosome-binding protein aMBF1 (putative translation factor)
MTEKKIGQVKPNYRLKQAREERGWSQAELARRIDAPSYQNIS